VILISHLASFAIICCYIVLYFIILPIILLPVAFLGNARHESPRGLPLPPPLRLQPSSTLFSAGSFLYFSLSLFRQTEIARRLIRRGDLSSIRPLTKRIAYYSYTPGAPLHYVTSRGTITGVRQRAVGAIYGKQSRDTNPDHVPRAGPCESLCSRSLAFEAICAIYFPGYERLDREKELPSR